MYIYRFSFGVGGDGKVYEGRGFNVVGAHAPRYNDKSVGICVIGDWTSKIKQILTKLIDYIHCIFHQLIYRPIMFSAPFTGSSKSVLTKATFSQITHCLVIGK